MEIPSRFRWYLALFLLSWLAQARAQVTVVTPDAFPCTDDFLTPGDTQGWQVVFTPSRRDDPRDPSRIVPNIGSLTVQNGQLVVSTTTGDSITAWISPPADFLTGLSDFDAVAARFTRITNMFGEEVVPDGAYVFFRADDVRETILFNDGADRHRDLLSNTELISANFTFVPGDDITQRARTQLGTTFLSGVDVTDFYIRIDFAGSGDPTSYSIDRVQRTNVDRFSFNQTAQGWTQFTGASETDPRPAAAAVTTPESPALGDPDLLVSFNSQNEAVWLQAPDNILGSWEGVVDFELGVFNTQPLATESMPPAADRNFVAVLTGPGGFATFTADSSVFDDLFNGFNIPIVEAANAWVVQEGTWDALLANVTGFYLSADPFSISAPIDSMRFPVTVRGGSFRRVRCPVASSPPPAVVVVDSEVRPAFEIAGPLPIEGELILEESTDLDSWMESEVVIPDPGAAVQQFQFFRATGGPATFFRLSDPNFVPPDDTPGDQEDPEEGIMEQSVAFAEGGQQSGLTTVYSSVIQAMTDLEIQEIVISDNELGLGADGIYSGFDLDFLVLDRDGDLATTNDQI